MPDWESVTFVVPPNLKQRLSEVAKERMTSTSAILRELLLKHLRDAEPASITEPEPTKAEVAP